MNLIDYSVVKYTAHSFVAIVTLARAQDVMNSPAVHFFNHKIMYIRSNKVCVCVCVYLIQKSIGTYNAWGWEGGVSVGGWGVGIIL